MDNIIRKYFNLSPKQEELLNKYVQLLLDWNRKINLISRQDQANVWEHHILHSLSIAKFFDLSQKRIIDVGTGGGLPGIPLAIMFPNAQFTLIDSIEKKTMALSNICQLLSLNNVSVKRINAKECHEKFDFVVARAVADLRKFYKLTKHLVDQSATNPKGILYLKGGDIRKEIQPFARRTKIFELRQVFDLEFFETKKLIFIQF